MESGDTERFFGAVTIEAAAGDSDMAIPSGDSRIAPKSAPFSCPVGCEVGDELAVVAGFGGCKIMLLRVV